MLSTPNLTYFKQSPEVQVALASSLLKLANCMITILYFKGVGAYAGLKVKLQSKDSYVNMEQSSVNANACTIKVYLIS